MSRLDWFLCILDHNLSIPTKHGYACRCYLFFKEMFEDTKGVFIRFKSKKDRQQEKEKEGPTTGKRKRRTDNRKKKKKDRQQEKEKEGQTTGKRKRTNNNKQNITQKTKDRATQTPLKTGGKLRCIGGSCSTCGTRQKLIIGLTVIKLLEYKY